MRFEAAVVPFGKTYASAVCLRISSCAVSLEKLVRATANGPLPLSSSGKKIFVQQGHWPWQLIVLLEKHPFGTRRVAVSLVPGAWYGLCSPDYIKDSRLSLLASGSRDSSFWSSTLVKKHNSLVVLGY